MSPKENISFQESISKRLRELSPEKRMLLEKRLRKEDPRPITSSAHEPIAIIGMACRFPGGVDSPEAFWKLLCEGRDAISEISEERWRLSILDKGELESDENAAAALGRVSRCIDQFDPAFFDISPREAATMDPQQRIAMEVAWEALESAGQPLPVLTASDTGIFMGLHSQSSDYYWLQLVPPGNWMRMRQPAVRTVLPPTAYRIFLTFTARAWPSIRPAPLRWLRCIWPARACEAGNAAWHSPAA